MTQLLLQYSYLQVLDFLTTVAFLLNGVREGNPLVRFAIDLFPSPIGGLVFVKVLAVWLGLYFWQFGKPRLLGRIHSVVGPGVSLDLGPLIVTTTSQVC